MADAVGVWLRLSEGLEESDAEDVAVGVLDGVVLAVAEGEALWVAEGLLVAVALGRPSPLCRLWLRKTGLQLSLDRDNREEEQEEE